MEVNTYNKVKNFEFDVGGQIFKFAKGTLQLPYLEGSVFQIFASGKYSSETPFLDGDPKLFEKWCAPYIRHQLLPTMKNLTDPYDRNHLVALANSIGLVHLADHVKQKIIEHPRLYKFESPHLNGISLGVNGAREFHPKNTIFEVKMRFKEMFSCMCIIAKGVVFGEKKCDSTSEGCEKLNDEQRAKMWDTALFSMGVQPLLDEDILELIGEEEIITIKFAFMK